MLVVYYSVLVYVLILDNHCFILCFLYWCCDLLLFDQNSIYFLLNVDCLLNSTVLSIGKGENLDWLIPEFTGICRLHLSTR